MTEEKDFFSFEEWWEAYDPKEKRTTAEHEAAKAAWEYRMKSEAAFLRTLTKKEKK